MSVSLGFELLVQAALGFVSQSAIKSIIYTVSKQISPSAEGAKEALPHRSLSTRSINQQQ